MKRLVLSNTYYQLLFAIQLRLTIFKNDEVSILISDHSNNAEIVAGHLKKLHLFSEVCYIQTQGSKDSRNRIDKISDFISIAFGNKNKYSSYISKLENTEFDEFLTFNYDIRAYGVYSDLAQFNKDIKVSRFEESLLTYSTEIMFTNRRRIIGFFRKLQGKPAIESTLKYFYCFYPELYKGPLEAIGVPTISNNSKIADIIDDIFDIDKTKLKYDARYIFFTSVYDFEGGEPIGEFELACKIRDLVGNDNLLIKLHMFLVTFYLFI